MNPEVTFPRLEVRDLTGMNRQTPECFRGSWNIVFVAFRRQQQQAIDSWIPWAHQAEEGGRLRFYELPVLSGTWKIFRTVIDGGMATGVGSKAAQQRTLTYYGDTARIARLLAIPRRTVMTILLIDGAGVIVDRAEGPFDPATADRFDSRLRHPGSAPAA